MTAAPPVNTTLIESLADVSDRYDVLFCDLWGCLHDGLRAHPSAVAALRAFRAGGGVVILMTNSPRPRGAVARQIGRLGAPEDCWDAIAASGDAALLSVAAGDWGRRVHHIGAPRDEAFFEAAALERVPLEEAESVIVTGLRDDAAETPDDYRDELREMQLRGLRMLSANPDIHVDVGETRVYCAGALAAAYEKIGGEARSYGKPHPPIYDMGRRLAAEAAGRDVPDDRILCVGDGILTDIAGALAEGLESLFISGGLALERTGGDPERPDPALLDRFLAEHRLSPRWSMGRLR